jgi:hypothetical protein
VQEAKDRMEARCDLTAEYVRDFLHTVLEFAPLDHFTPADSGGWLIDEDAYHRLPKKIRRIFEDIQPREVRAGKKTQRQLWVKLISKTAALKLAAKYTLSQ